MDNEQDQESERKVKVNISPIVAVQFQKEFLLGRCASLRDHETQQNPDRAGGRHRNEHQRADDEIQFVPFHVITPCVWRIPS